MKKKKKKGVFCATCGSHVLYMRSPHTYTYTHIHTLGSSRHSRPYSFSCRSSVFFRVNGISHPAGDLLERRERKKIDASRGRRIGIYNIPSEGVSGALSAGFSSLSHRARYISSIPYIYIYKVCQECICICVCIY